MNSDFGQKEKTTDTFLGIRHLGNNAHVSQRLFNSNVLAGVLRSDYRYRDRSVKNNEAVAPINHDVPGNL